MLWPLCLKKEAASRQPALALDAEFPPAAADKIDQICNIPIAQSPSEGGHRELCHSACAPTNRTNTIPN
jgi:hypothetical protein